MSPGPDDDEDDAAIEIDAEPATGPIGSIGAPDHHRDGDTPADFDAIPGAPLEFQASLLEQAAVADPHADLALAASEAAAADDGGRRAVLLLQVARLQEAALGDGQAALETLRAAFAADPSLIAALWPLRRLLAAGGHFDELVAAYDAVLGSAGMAPRDRADLLVERGRLLEDRLGRAEDAAASYREALELDGAHAGALLCLYVLGVRTGDGAAVEAALGGLAARAGEAARRGAITAELAHVQREASVAGGEDGARAAAAERALRTLEDALAAAAPGSPVVALLAELDALARAAPHPEVQVRALEELARRAAALDPPLAVALLRERARLLRDSLHDPRAALDALEEAARLTPDDTLVAIDLIDIAERLDRPDVMAQAVAAFEAAPGASGERALRAIDLVLRQAQALARGGHHREALDALAASATVAAAGAFPEVQALRIALLARAGDATGLADAFAAEGGRLAGRAAGWSLVLAGATRAWVAGDPAGAEALYRQALEAAPGFRPALDGLEALLRAGDQDRSAELAEVLEMALGGGGGPPDEARDTFLREQLVALYRDDVDRPDRALGHQQQLVAMAPGDLRRRVRQRDLELAGGVDASDAVEAAAEEAETVLALAASAGDPAVSAALKVEAARLLAPAIGDGAPAGRLRAEQLLREAVLDDVSGLAASGLERVLPEPGPRAQAVADELAAVAAHAPAETVRALRFRLAHHQVSAGHFAEAIATLTPLRSEGDPLARGWSWDLARQSRDAILEVAVLSEEAGAATSVVADRADVLVALGEALERAGDPDGAGDAFRRALGHGGSADAALGLLRLAASAAAPSPMALLEALQAVAASSEDDLRIADAARREAALLRVASGRVDEDDLVAAAPPDATLIERAEAALLRWSAAVRRGDSAVVAAAMLEMARGLAAPSGAASSDAVPLLARAAARARLGGADAAERVAGEAWRAARATTLAAALSDLPVSPGAGWPPDRADPRRARAARIGGPLGLALDLEAALDAERRGALGAALAGYGRVIAAEPDRLEAWEGIRRVARAGGDVVGEARALARLGTLIKSPAHASATLSEAARLFEEADRWDEAIALWGRALEVAPDDDAAFTRLRELLLADPDAPGRPAALDRLLSHRLGAVPLSDAARVALLLERARHRIDRMGNAEGAIQDFKRILNIDPQHDDALWEVAHLAITLGEPAAAAPLLERFVIGAADEERVAVARLDLAACYEAMQERARAIEVLRRAAALRPHDPAPMERLTELHLRLGEWRSAIETLRGWEPRLPDARERAALHLRIGGLLRDLGRDATGAALSFRMAAELDPMGEGTRALVALHEALGDSSGALQTIERELAQLRQALGEDPLDGPRLERLGEFLSALRSRAPRTAGLTEAAAAVAEVRALLVVGGARPRAQTAPPAPRPLAPKNGGAFWAQLAYPGALGFLAEIWPHLVESAAVLFPPPPSLLAPREGRIPPGTDRRLAWIEASAAAIGLPGLRLFLGGAEAAPTLVLPIEDPEPALVLGAAALQPNAAARFQIGRALGVLRDRATVLERVSDEALKPLFAAAALVAGAPTIAPPPDAVLRWVAKAMSRKDKKALTLQASRFGFESIDTARWQRAVLRSADRLGLLVAGDVGAAARAVADGDSREALRASERALDLLRFALGPTYPALRPESGLVP